MATPLVALHVASDTEGLSTPSLGALEGLFTSVGVAVNAETAGATECLVAGGANVAILALREEVARGGL